ncbi:MAG: hypothetical protein KA362_11400 [Chloroflexi bacterium]|nr:hypothetical protein [Chloroflexota bacterium]MBK8933821.1 hypothetical protein [Chloroflexota bacterium]MBP6804705.1 hypothetical protein [Chloroflexota bacterium]MBP7590115.1 hypothetical protein [Chloroflexota bacterium]
MGQLDVTLGAWAQNLARAARLEEGVFAATAVLFLPTPTICGSPTAFVFDRFA